MLKVWLILKKRMNNDLSWGLNGNVNGEKEFIRKRIRLICLISNSNWRSKELTQVLKSAQRMICLRTTHDNNICTFILSYLCYRILPSKYFGLFFTQWNLSHKDKENLRCKVVASHDEKVVFPRWIKQKMIK